MTTAQVRRTAHATAPATDLIVINATAAETVVAIGQGEDGTATGVETDLAIEVRVGTMTVGDTGREEQGPPPCLPPLPHFIVFDSAFC